MKTISRSLYIFCPSLPGGGGGGGTQQSFISGSSARRSKSLRLLSTFFDRKGTRFTCLHEGKCITFRLVCKALFPTPSLKQVPLSGGASPNSPLYVGLTLSVPLPPPMRLEDALHRRLVPCYPVGLQTECSSRKVC